MTLNGHSGTWHLQVDGGSTSSCTAQSGSTAVNLADLTPAANYAITAWRETFSNCKGPPSVGTLTGTVFTTRPGKVTDLTATAGSDASIDLSWTAAAGATRYKVQWKSGAEDWSSTRQVRATTNSHTLTKSTVTANTAYTIRVAAANADSDGAWSDEVVATPVEVTLQASSVEASTATLTIANRTGTWYYKQITPTAGNCSSVGAAASTTASGLSPGLTHTFSAYADNQCAGTVLATTPQFLTKPGKAAGVSATAAAGALDVSWTATTGAASYKVQWKSSSDSDWDAAGRQTTATTASATIPSLINGTTYTVRVAAVNDTGDGAWSDTATGTPSGRTLRLVTPAANGGVFAITGAALTWYSKVTPPADATCETNANRVGKTVTSKSSGSSYTITAYSDSSCNTRLTSLDFTTLPAKVAGVSATARDKSLGVSWTAETGSAATSYKVQWKSSADTDYDAASRQVVTTKTSATITGLTNDTLYTIRVAGTTAAGDGAWSDDATGTPSATAVMLQVQQVTVAQATLKLLNHSAAFWYRARSGLAHGRCNSGSHDSFIVSAQSGTEVTVTAYSNNNCTTALTSIDFITLPAKTAGVTLDNRGASLGVSWTAVTGAASYKVQWKSGNESFGSSRETTATTTSATLTALDNNTAYTVRVAAVNASGDGAWSDTATETPSVRLTAGNVTSTGATLTVAGHTGTVYLSGRGGGSYSLACTAVSGGTHSPTLQGNTTYEFKAYGSSSCTGTALASTSFTTSGAVTLKAINIGQHSVTLFLDGWRSLPKTNVSHIVHKAGSSQPIRSCGAVRGPAFATHNDIDSLEAGTTYTAQYFRGASCAAIERFASVTFTTLSEGAQPELTASNVTSTGATLTLANHTGNWWYENEDVANSCTAVTGGATTVHLSGLTANTNYVFIARSHEGCGDSDATEKWYSRATFTTTGPLSVAVSGKTSTGLTVNLRGYTEANGYPEQWSVRVVRSDGSGGYTGSACQTLSRATTSATVTGLEAGKQYTIQINKRANCHFFGSIVNETPVTTVSLVSGSVGPSSASLTLDHHEGDWSYQGGEVSGQASASASGAGRGRADASSTAAGPADAAGADAGAASLAAGAAGQCHAASAGQYTANLADLAPGASYTYTAWAGRDCAGLELAQVSFDTPAASSPPPSGGDDDSGAADLAPAFADGAAIGDLAYTQDAVIEPLVLPAAEGGDGALAYALDPAPPAGLAFDAQTRTLSGTPAEAANAATWTYTATDADQTDPDSASLSFTITVAEADPSAPSFGGVVLEDQVYALNAVIEPLVLPAAEGGEGELTYTLEPALPAGLAFDAQTRTLSGMPTAAASATTYTYTATDANGNTAALTFSITVAAAVPALPAAGLLLLAAAILAARRRACARTLTR